MDASCSLLIGDQRQSESLRALLQLVEHACPVAFLVSLLALIDVLLAFDEHGVDQARELVRGGSDGFAWRTCTCDVDRS